MIVISRQLGQALVIGDSIMVQVVEIERNRVRLGVIAPREYTIWREEDIALPHAVVDVEKPGGQSEGAA